MAEKTWADLWAHFQLTYNLLPILLSCLLSEMSSIHSNPICCLCEKPCEDPFGNNAEPVKAGICCDACNIAYVIPSRAPIADNNESDSDSDCDCAEGRCPECADHCEYCEVRLTANDNDYAGTDAITYDGDGDPVGIVVCNACYIELQYVNCDVCGTSFDTKEQAVVVDKNGQLKTGCADCKIECAGNVVQYYLLA